MRFLVTIQRDAEGGYLARCPVLPGCMVRARSLEAVEAAMLEAIEGYLDSLHTPLSRHWQEQIEFDATAVVTA